MKGVAVSDVRFLDFDNDGHQDLLVAGVNSDPAKSGVRLFHNDSTKGFSDVSNLLPKTVMRAGQIATVDFNADGDEDIFLAGASGAQLFAAVPQALATSLGGVAPPTGEHTMGGMQMGVDPATSVVDANGRMHQMDNVYVADGSVFATSSGSNPTLTIMAVALRIARGLTGQRRS